MNNVVNKFKQRRIVKAQLGTLLKKGWDWWKNSNQIAAIAESPAVMTAAGWRVDKNGQAKQNQQNNEDVKQLRNNLATIGESGVTAPTMAGDVNALITAIRHPVQVIKAINNGISNATKYVRNINRINKELNKGINSEIKRQKYFSKKYYTPYPYEEKAKIPIENNYMYHSWDDPSLGFVKNGKHYNLERRPGSVEIYNRKYASNRFQTDQDLDRIWWDTEGHNSGDNVLVMKLGGFQLNSPMSGARPGGGLYYPSYRTTFRPDINNVVRFKYDPIGNTYTAYSPFREITTNKMSLDELFTP